MIIFHFVILSSIRSIFQITTSTPQSMAFGPSTAMRSPMKEPEQEEITIQQLLNNGNKNMEIRCLTAEVIIIQDPLPEDKNVMKQRRRMVLADTSGTMLAFIMRTKPARFVEKESVLISYFRVSNRCITIHDRTVVTK